jgi:sulfonate transport system substrate-binding protein
MRKMFAIIGLAALVWGVAPTVSRAEPTRLRISWVVVPAELTPIMLAPRVARHEGTSYVLEHTHFAGGPLSVTAFASGDIDITGFGYSTIASAIDGAGIDDLRVIADVSQDGAEGWYTNGFMVRKDGPIRTVEDLKGRAVAINAKGGLIDIPLRIMMRMHGIDDRRDATILEVALPNMKATLLEGKVELVGTVLPFAMDPQLRANARVLFTAYDAVGRQQVGTLVARAGFIAQNRAALVDFLEDYIRAVRWYIDPANRQEAVQILADFTKQPAALFDSWVFTHGDQYHNPDALPDPQLLQNNIDMMRTLGGLKGPIDMKQHTDASLVTEAAARIPR